MLDRLTPGVSAAILGPSVRDVVARAMGNVPRHHFVPDERRMTVYLDRSVPIGAGRRCPRPSLVARMLDACKVLDGRVLVVGAGTGYVAACAAETASEVVAVESDPALAAQAAGALSRIRGRDRIVLRQALHSPAALEAAPFDAILVCGALERSPRRLMSALKDEGVLVAPLLVDGAAKLYAYQRVVRGHLRRDLGAVDVEVLPSRDADAC